MGVQLFFHTHSQGTHSWPVSYVAISNQLLLLAYGGHPCTYPDLEAA